MEILYSPYLKIFNYVTQVVISLKPESKEKRTTEEQDIITVSQGILPFTILTWKYLLVWSVCLVLG
jgi:hypothetical protein